MLDDMRKIAGQFINKPQLHLLSSITFRQMEARKQRFCQECKSTLDISIIVCCILTSIRTQTIILIYCSWLYLDGYGVHVIATNILLS